MPILQTIVIAKSPSFETYHQTNVTLMNGIFQGKTIITIIHSNRKPSYIEGAREDGTCEDNHHGFNDRSEDGIAEE